MLAGCASAPDDTDDPLVQHAGPRATVTINQQSGRGEQLEAFFVEALTNSGAFYVIEDASQAVLQDKALENAGIIEEGATDEGSPERADLELVCTVTDERENASGSQSGVQGRSFLSSITGGLAGGGGGATQQGRVSVNIRIKDRRRGRVLATARGEGFSVGASSNANASVYKWSRGLGFGSVGGNTSGYENVDMAAAFRRATVRAVNDLVQKIPESYFKHDE